MKTLIGLSLVLAAAALPGTARAQDDAAAGPLNPPVQNINAGLNPTAPAQLPSTYTDDSLAPTYPAGNNGPASRGGSIGDDPSKRRDMPDPLHQRERKFEQERALPEPGQNTHTSTPPGAEASPGTPSDVDPDSSNDVNPGAVRGGPQP